MKRFYHILALLALINMFAACGFVGFLFASGRLDAERVDQIATVLRGEFPTTQPVGAAAAEPPLQESSRTELSRMQSQQEYFELVAQRHQREIQDRRELNQAIQLDVLRQLEQIERVRTQFEEDRRKAALQSEQEGFARTLEMYEGMDPVRAKDLLRNHSKEADTVRVLMEMDPMRARKIINTCRSDEDLLWAGRILAQMNQLNKVPGGGVEGPMPSDAEE
jgi:hypothetical protein